MKSGKVKIAFSAVCLVAALTLAIFTAYAWFTTNTKAQSDGIKSQVVGPDYIIDIEYYEATLVEKSTTDYTIDENNPLKPLDGELFPKMKDFEPGVSTTVLVKLTVTFSETASGNYTLRANVNHADAYDLNNGLAGFRDKNYLSNVVYFQEATLNGNGNYSVSGKDRKDFIKSQNGVKQTYDGKDDAAKRESSIALNDSVNSENENVLYFIMDYMPDQIYALYGIMLNYFDNATLNEQIIFNHDMDFDLIKG